MSTKKFSTVEDVLAEWLRRVHLYETCHYNASNHFRHLHSWLGIPATVLSAFAGTSVFVSLTEQVSTAFKVVVGAVSVLVAILTGLQTFLRYEERSEKHLMAGRQFGILRQQIEQYMTMNQVGEENPHMKHVTELRAQMEALTRESLGIPQRIFDSKKREEQARITASLNESRKGA